MICPSLLAWVKERNDFSDLPVHRGEVGAFEKIALDAGQREILGYCPAVMFDGDDVVNLMRNDRVLTVNQAVFATTTGPLEYQSSQCLRKVIRHKDAHLAGGGALFHGFAHTGFQHAHEVIDLQVGIHFRPFFG